MSQDNHKPDPGAHSLANLGEGLQLVYVIGTYPLLTTTFIDREIRGLRKRDVDVQVLSIRQPRNPLSPEQEAMKDSVIYLLPVSWATIIKAHLRFLLRNPFDYLGILSYLISRPNQTLAERLKTVTHFAEGVVAAHKLQKYSFDLIHAHFLDRATTVAMIVSRLLKVPYTMTAHANDIYVRPMLIAEKMEHAQLVFTCTDYNRAHLASIESGRFDSKIRCIYHGLETESFGVYKPSNGNPPIILSVAQLKEKKGLIFLIRACRILKDRGYDLVCQIVGEGPLRDRLDNEIRQLDLAGTVILCGSLPHQEVIAKYYQATVFTLPAVVSADGDRDGIPNVILEAMAAGLPVVSTNHSGIPEVVQDGINGLLVPPADEHALADAMAWIIDHPQARQRFGQAGKQTVIEKFDVEKNVARLLNEFITVQHSMN